MERYKVNIKQTRRVSMETLRRKSLFKHNHLLGSSIEETTSRPKHLHNRLGCNQPADTETRATPILCQPVHNYNRVRIHIIDVFGTTDSFRPVAIVIGPSIERRYFLSVVIVVRIELVHEEADSKVPSNFHVIFQLI